MEVWLAADGTWMVRSEGFRGLFGTDTLPTAYRSGKPLAAVVAALAEKWPGEVIRAA